MQKFKSFSLKVEQQFSNILTNKLISLIIFLCLGGVCSYLVGQDANWDLKNYHIYAAFSFLDGRFYGDLMAGGMQSYFNPLLDLPYYILSFGPFFHFPKALSFVMGGYYGLLIFITLRLFMRVFSRSKYTIILSLLTMSIASTGASAISQVGATFNEIQLAVFVIFGLYFFINGVFTDNLERKIDYKYIILSGLFIGIANGLKLTSAIYTPAIVLSLLLVYRDFSFLRISFLFSISWLFAFLFAGGSWFLKVFYKVGNPIFPMYNELFKSDWYPSVNFLDGRFKPQTIYDYFFYPVKWSVNNHSVVTEVAFQDPRFLIGLFSLLILLLVGLKTKNKKNANEHINNDIAKFLYSFTAISYITWISLFSIIRYAVVIEILLGLSTSILVLLTCSAISKKSIFLYCLAMILILYLVQERTVYPNWGRIKYSDTTYKVIVPEVKNDALIVFIGGPLSYIAPFVEADNVSFLGITHTTVEAKGYKLYVETRNAFNNSNGNVYAIINSNSKYLNSTLSEFGYSIVETNCKPIISNLGNGEFICPLIKK